MSEYFDAIEKAKQSVARNFLESCGFSVQDNLQKSHVEGIFESDASQRGFTIDKKGFEVKEKLRNMYTEEELEVSRNQSILTSIPIQIGESPNGDSSRELYYIVDGWDEAVGDIPAFYTSEQIGNTEVKEEKVNNYGQFGEKDFEVSSPSNTPKQRLMYTYNEALKRLAEGRKELKMLQTMLTDFQDNKIYKLTVREAAMLGF